jgi:DNA-binding NtrC family response regulator
MLLIDDEVAIRNLYQLYFEQNGFLVTTAAGVNEGLRLVCESEFEAILVDVYLQDGSGVDLAKKVRDMGKRAAVLLMSGYAADEQLEQMAENLRIEGWHFKGDGLNELLQTLTGLMNGRPDRSTPLKNSSDRLPPQNFI